MPNPDVTALQRSLRASRDYLGPITGVLDQQTAQALRFFQARNGLNVSGIADAATRSILRCPGRGDGAAGATASGSPLPRKRGPSTSLG